MHPDTLITTVFRLTPPQKSALRKLGLATVQDLLYHFPTRYESAGSQGHVGHLVAGTKVTLYGTFSGLKAKKLWKSRRAATEGWLEDGSGKVKCLWFNQPYIASYIKEGVVMRVTGTVSGTAEKPYLSNPQTEISSIDEMPAGMFVNEAANLETPTVALFPSYPESQGITSLWFHHALKRIFEAGVHTMIEDPVPAKISERYHLPDLAAAFVYIHSPEKAEHAAAARKRFAFEEIFVLQVLRAQERDENSHTPTLAITGAQERADEFLAALGFKPTGAQRRTIADIITDLSHPYPMARLLEGDVGSGKTLVAAAASYAVVTSRPPNRNSGTLQVAYMAPTEILAQQHFESFIRYFQHLPINIALLTGSGCKKFPSKIHKGGATSISRSQLLKWVANGEIAMVIGTHALIQKSVQFKHLALCIVDEQHRFGTKQRKALAQKSSDGGGYDISPTRTFAQKAVRENNISPSLEVVSEGGIAVSDSLCESPGRHSNPAHALTQSAAPHFLSMTATPIPRTLALTVYGDLDLSVLDELPPGRAKITTMLIKNADRKNAYATARDELKKGRQAYVICPRINEPDPQKINAVQAKSVKAEAARLQKEVFPEYKVGMLHGAMTPVEKDNVMTAFTEHKIDILVATSVVEVGVNVPNATVILIEGAERFGLAQLHQLRGRVMRSSHPPFCFLLPDTTSAISLKRLKTLEKSSDGFKLAEADLQSRGAGDLYGHKQWGVSDVGMEALTNPRLIEAARTEAQNLVQKEPNLSAYKALQKRVHAVAQAFHEE